MNILQHTSPIKAIESVCTELGLSHTTYTINHEDTHVSATIMTGATDDTTVFVHPNWIYIVRNEHYLQLHNPDGLIDVYSQTLYFGPILRGTMGLDLSWCDNHVSEIEYLMRALELAKKDWYAIAWGNDHMPTTMNQKSLIEKRLERHRLGFYPAESVDKVKINADIEFDEDGHVRATTVLELDPIEVQKLRELDFIWHVEPTAEPKPSVEVFPISAEIDGIDNDYRIWLGEDNYWTHAVPFDDCWNEAHWQSVKAYYGFTEYNVDRTGACENGACIWFK